MLCDLRTSISLPIGLLTALAVLAASCVPPPLPPGARSYYGEAHESADEDDGCRDDEPASAPGLIGMPPDRARGACRRRPRSSTARSAAPVHATCTEQAQVAEAALAAETARARRESLYAVAAARGLAIPDGVRARIDACEDATLLGRWIARAAVAAMAEDILVE